MMIDAMVRPGCPAAVGRSVFWVTALLALCGCASLATPGMAGNTPMATLPLAAAGITDGRAEFAAQFSYELSQQNASADVARWLHLAPAAAPLHSRALPRPQAGISVLVVPGVLGECLDNQALPFSDGVVRPRPLNYVEGYGPYLPALGRVRAVHVQGRASSEANAGLVAAAVLEEAAREDVHTVILVGYSKGLPDALVAIQHLHARAALPHKLKALVSVSGVVLGTPIADALGGLYDALVAPLAPMDCPASLGGEVRSLSVSERTRWLASFPIPPQIATFTVVAHTTRADTAPALVPFFDILSRTDTLNDGQVHASWSVLPRSLFLAEVRSDHWGYVLALEKSPHALIRGLASGVHFPRDAFFQALIKTVASRLGG